MKSVAATCILAAFILCFAGRAQSQYTHPAFPAQNGIHGTIVIVVQTKDGFVLVGDSRGTGFDGRQLPDEYQKVFSIGKRSGLVVAGVIGAWSGEISDSIATHLIFADHMVSGNSRGYTPLADAASESVVDGIREEADLFDGDQAVSPTFAAFSAVSVDEQGHPEWITMVLSPAIRMDPYARKYVDVKVERIRPAPISKVMALGSVEDTVNALVNADSPTVGNLYSQAAVMRRYYYLKSVNRLTELSLEEGEELAQWLIKAAIDNAAPSDGVGGSVDVLTVTKSGINWVRKKNVMATPPPMFSIRVSDSGLAGTLDGFDCVRCTVPPNARLFFTGKRKARIVQPRFTGPCELSLSNSAYELEPETTRRLTDVFGIWCDVFKENPSGGRTKLSTATMIGQPAVSLPNYSSLCNSDLKAGALDTVRQVRELLAAYEAEESRFESEKIDYVLHAQGQDTESRQVRSFEDRLLSDDRLKDLMDHYNMRFASSVKAFRIELSNRLHLTPGKGIALNTAMNPSQMYTWTEETENLANQLPVTVCAR